MDLQALATLSEGGQVKITRSAPMVRGFEPRKKASPIPPFGRPFGRATIQKAQALDQSIPPLPGSTPASRREQHRQGVERLLARADYLPPEERALIHTVFRNGTTAIRVATLAGHAPEAARLRRRIRAIIARALSEKFGLMARQIMRGNAARWPSIRRRVGEMLYLQGMPLRTAAQELGVTVHVVRDHRTAIQAIFDAGAR